MAKTEQTSSMTAFDARKMIEKGALTSELEMERAVWIERSLHLLTNDYPELESLRKEIFNLIVQYESIHWSNFDSIPKEQFKESNRAEKQVKREFAFFRKRKELILAKLKKYGLNQNDLAEILAHSKSYTSELLNSTRAFSMNDLIIIHRLFDIKLDDLICTEISPETKKRIDAALKKVASNPSKDQKAISLVHSITATGQSGLPKKDDEEYRKHPQPMS